jgi:hypothetical protein
MNFSFTADGGGLGGNEASVNTATKWAPVQQNDSFSKSPMMVSDFDDELIGAAPAPPKPIMVLAKQETPSGVMKEEDVLKKYGIVKVTSS